MVQVGGYTHRMGTGDDIVIGNNLNDDIAGGSQRLHHGGAQMI